MERLIEEERIKVENENMSDGPVKDCDYISIKEEMNFNEVKEEHGNMEDVLVNDCDHISIKNEVYYNEIENDIINIKEPVGKDENFPLHTKQNDQLEENYNPLNRENLKPVEKEIESINHINLNILDKDLSLGNENEENSNSSSVIDILRGLLTESGEHETLCPDSKTVEESASFDVVGSSSEVGVENNTLPQRFKVNLAAIDSISKENQASELQSLDGLSVYDQATLEAGILQQVDEALDQELETPARSQTAVLLEPGEEETEMERLIRLGEMTPFGTTLNMSTTPDLKPIDRLAEIEKYFQTQQELHGKRNKKPAKRKQITTLNEKGKEHLKAKENARDLLKEKILNRNIKKKKRKKETLGTETDDFVPWTEKPDPVAGETADMNPDDASGSEYVPSESDSYPSSGDEREIKHKEKVEKPALGIKRKIKTQKPYKIPEDWASDDTDWEYSDEEGNVKKNKRSKKELDDGDVDAFNRRIRMWQREKRNVDEEIQEYHEFDEGYKLPLDIWNKLYIYQRVGVKWLWELDKQGCGGVLGDEMGLGKTIQVIAFLAGLHVSQLTDKDTRHRGLGPSLIICPTTLMHQWVKEFHTWYPPLRVAILHESGTFCGKQRSRLIGNMVQAGGVLIASYTGAIQYKDDFLTRRWHYVILDEGHKIRNPDTKITLVAKQLKTTHRIILSGSPMQNNLKELWSLFDFVFPGKLGTLPVFLEQFAVPITQGGYTNASQVQVMTAFKCATVLKDTIAPYLLRRMKIDVKSHVNLPEKSEQVLFCRLTDEQRHFYKDYVESGEVSRIMEGHMKIFVGLINLRKICNHPDLYSGGTKLFGGDTEDILPPEERYGYWGKAGKMIVVETLLKLWKKQGHRVLVFTQSRQMLSIMETFVKQAGYSYLKLDGGTSIAARQPLINKFNQDTSYFVLLLTTRVGGLGVNLTGANRVLIYDPDWNPATDTQARERAWRIGQKQNVTVYRLITAGTIEEKMYHRQIFKQFLCNKVLKDPRQRRFFKSNDLFELFTLKETDVNGSTETGAIFAGTNSEVKLDPTKTYKHRKITPRLSAEPPAVTFSRKKAEKKKNLEEKQKENSKQNGSGNDSGICFSNEKIERMKKLAQMLSQKCVKNVSPVKSDAAPKALEENKPKSEVKIEDVVMISDEDSSNTRLPELSTAGTSSAKESPGLSPDLKRHKHKKRRKDKKKSRHRDAKFEGETIPHLVKTGVTNSSTAEVNADDGQNYATQDEYVLQKLFAKSGLQTALKHDTIMEGGPADYALVEGEADRVAKQAVEKLQESRRECWRATTGVPTFTGINGARNFQFKPKFGSAKTSFGGQSSSEILERIRKRNCIAEAKDPEMDLVQDIRQFVSSFGGTVTTSKVISRFEGRLAEGSSPLFKSLLSKICTFYRGPDKLGYWTLKEDFNW